MWHDHPFSQRNKATKKTMAAEVGDKGRGWPTFEKKEGVRNIGGSW